MFKKKCPRCGKGISRDFEFCPYCGFNIRKEEEERDSGFLGKDDNIGFPDFRGIPFGFEKIFNNLLKQIDLQFRELDKEFEKNKTIKKPEISRGISISISTASGKKPEIKIRRFGQDYEEKKKKRIQRKPADLLSISEEEAKKLAKLPREEAETSVRRLGNKVIYEIDLPGVKSLKNVLINKLENSIEIKAFSKDKVYVKLLPIGLPILNYRLKNGKLILELEAKT